MNNSKRRHYNIQAFLMQGAERMIPQINDTSASVWNFKQYLLPVIPALTCQQVQSRIWIFIALFCAILPVSCTSTSAPTDTASETIGNIADVSSDVASSTSPGSSSGLNLARAEAFVENNFVQVQIDIARGGGEHLDSLAILLQVPEENQEIFCNYARKGFDDLYLEKNRSPKRIVAILSQIRQYSADGSGHT